MITRAPRSVQFVPSRATPMRRGRQDGIVLFLTLIAVVAITMAGVAMMRSSDTAGLLSGNVAFKQSAVMEADRGVEAALAVLPTVPDLTNDDTARGYYASIQAAMTSPASVPNLLNITTANYCSAGSATAPTGTIVVAPVAGSTTGNCITYVIERMCSAAGYADDKICLILASQSMGGDVRNPGLKESAPYYRVTVRVDGPRNTVVYVQAIVAI